MPREFAVLQPSALVINYNSDDRSIVDNNGKTYSFSEAMQRIESEPRHVNVNMGFRTLFAFDGDINAMEAHKKTS